MLTSMQFLLSRPNGQPAPGADGLRGEGEAFLATTGWQQALSETGFMLLASLPEESDVLAMAGQRVFFAVAC